MRHAKVCVVILILLISSALGGSMKIKYFGHAMWEIATETTKIIVDPFVEIGYPMPENLTADIVIASHDHSDHNNFKLVIPPFQKITQIGTYTVKDAKVKMIESRHGVLEGRNLGDNFMSLITIDGITLLHCGDLGIIPEGETLNEIADVDILFIPIGGKFTINAQTAKELIELIEPKIVFPMHYRTEKSTVEIDDFEPFETLYPTVEKIDSDTFLVTKDELSSEMKIIKLNYE